MGYRYPDQTKIRQRAIASIAPGKPPDQGLTLVECLVAITVVGITGLLITPPLFISAATRVQNRRAEQALEIAQGEIDRVRLLVEKERQSVSGVDADGTVLQGRILPPEVADIDAVDGPDTVHPELESVNSGCDAFAGTALANAQAALPIDTDGDCEADYLMQAFRSEGTSAPGADRLDQFRMGVRVYAESARDNLGELDVEEASLRYTTGLGNQQQRPLAVLYSDFLWSDRDNSVCQFYQLAGRCSSAPE